MKTNFIVISMIMVTSVITATKGQTATGEDKNGKLNAKSGNGFENGALVTSSEFNDEATPGKIYSLLPMTVFPDTVSNSISVSIPFSSSAKGKINIYNERGDIVYFKFYATIENIFEVAIPETVTPGNYFIQVIGDDKHAIQKFVKK